MRLPNGYGSIEKLPGNRRRPFCVRLTQAWDINQETQKVKQHRITIGYYATKKEAMQALAAYHETPYVINNYTLSDVYEKWSYEHFPAISESNIKGYKAAWKVLQPVENKILREIKLDHLQQALDVSGKNTPTLKKVKSLASQLFEYAVKHEYISADRGKIPTYLDISKPGNPDKIDRAPFSEDELATLWQHTDNDTVKIILMLIYTGVRISELLELDKAHLYLDKHYFDITKSKTKAGIRSVPIADKVYDYFVYFADNPTDFALANNGEPWQYRNFYDSYWKSIMERFDMHHRPHDTRHTCVSLLTAAGVDERIIKKIVGHSGNSVTQIVYTHIEVKLLLDAINKI